MLNILIPTDFSDNANKAMRYAVELFGEEANYVLVNGFEIPHSGATMLISIADILEKDSIQLLNEAKEALVSTMPRLEQNISIKAVAGSPSVALKKLTAKGEYDLVIMGTKGASGLKEVLIGSVASNVLSDVDCPVMAIPADAELQVPTKIVFAADDQVLIEGKLPQVLVDLSNRFDAEVLILNVVQKGELGHVGNAEDQKRRSEGSFEGVRHSIHFVEATNINEGIEAFIKANEVDVLAMVNRKNDLFSRMFGTSNTKAMMMHSSIPLFAFH
jgi:nucleotide-binding universal stress UspA family protein